MKKRQKSLIGIVVLVLLMCLAVAVTAFADKKVGDVISLSNADKADMATPSEAVPPEDEENIADEEEIEDETTIDETVSVENRSVRVATDSNAIQVTNETELIEAVEVGGTIELAGDIILTAPLYIESSIPIQLNGNNNTLSYSGDSNRSYMIWLNCNIQLSDITIDCTGLDYEKKNDYGRDKDYYAVWTGNKSNLVMQEGTNIRWNGDYDSLKNTNLRGIWIAGSCEMNDGLISGFPAAGLIVEKDSKFTMNDGEILSNGQGIGVMGTSILNGGIIRDNNGYGILNQSNVLLDGTEILGNYGGIFNSNEDGLSHEKFAPVTEIKSGVIAENYTFAIVNETGGTVTISGGEISGGIEYEEQLRAMRTKEAQKEACVIKNDNFALLNIQGGEIVSNKNGEITVLNGSSGKINMTGGTIRAEGNNSVVVKNNNKTAGDVRITGGEIQASGTGSITFENKGTMEISSDVILTSEQGQDFFVNVSYNNGGTVSPESRIVTIGEEIRFTITPESGYKIDDVKIDSVSMGAITVYSLNVTGKHSVEATFSKISGGGGSSSGGGGSSSGGRRTTVKTDPLETAGTWIQDEAGWWFKKLDGTYPASAWLMNGGNWFRFDEKGYMMTGWFTDADGKKYYLNLVSDGTKGAMKTGWQLIDGKWYYFNQVSDGTRGVLLVNTTTPDGFTVGADGVWIQ